MIQRQIGVDREIAAGTSVAPHVARPGDNRLQANRGRPERPGLVSDSAFVERSAAAQRARAIQRLMRIGEMTAGVVHDFRNILAVIESGLRLAERHSDEPEKASAFIAGARDGVDRGLKLTSQLLTFAKQSKLQVGEGNANELLRQLELFLVYSAGSEIRIALELASDIPNCRLDPSQFNAAILNLVVNARDAMPKGGEIRISTARRELTQGSTAPGTYVRVRVKDSGQGIPPGTLQQIFDPFFTTKGEQGTGLGLPQVDAFMRLIEGHVRVTSEIGNGTTFDLMFPSVEPVRRQTA